jgi:ribonuclease P protein component
MIKSLSQKKDFERVAKFGQPFFAPEFGFKMIKNNLEKNRYGIVVPVVIDKRATVRNQIRRRIKEVARLQDKNLKQGFDLMFLVRESVKDLKYKEIEMKLIGLFKKAGLL